MSYDEDYRDTVAAADRALQTLGTKFAEAAAERCHREAADESNSYAPDLDDQMATDQPDSAAAHSDAEVLAQLEAHVDDLDVLVNGKGDERQLADVIHLSERRAKRTD